MRFSFILLTLLSLTACSTLSNDKDASVIAEKVSNILDQMTLAEKVGQMTQVERKELDHISDLATYNIGSLLSGGGSAPIPNTLDAWVKMYNEYQTVSMQSSSGIPITADSITFGCASSKSSISCG